MSIDGRYAVHEIMPRHWEAEAKRSGFDAERALAHVRDIVARLPDAARDVLSRCNEGEADAGELNRLVDLFTARCSSLSSTFGAEPMSGRQVRLPGI